MHIGIIGAGITGLVAGRELAKAGHRVTIAESAGEAGGLAGTFPFASTRLESFYHHIFTSDLETIHLLQELGLGDKLLWQETPMGVYKNQRLYKFATPMDLLKFKPLSFINRLRFGLVILYLSRVKHWQKYEYLRAQDWIRKWFGQQVWGVIFGPLLHGKFGDLAPGIGMPWFYSRIHTRARSRGQGMAKESLGYLRGSFQVMHEALAKEILARGGEIRFGHKVKKLNMDQNRVAGWETDQGLEKFDAVLATPAPPILLSLLPEKLPDAYWDKLRRIQYLGNVCAVLTVKKSLSPIYWMNIPDVNSPFIAVIEHTNFISPENYNGKHVIYLSAYLPVNHPRYRAGDRELLPEFYAYLQKVIPAFTPADVAEAKVFRADYAQPVIRAGYSETLVPLVTPLPGLFAANMAQIYPEDRGMSYSIRLGREAAAEIIKSIS